MNILTNVKNTNTATHVQQSTARNSKSQQRDVVLANVYTKTETQVRQNTAQNSKSQQRNMVLAAISSTAVPAIHPHIEEAFSLLEI